MSPQIRADYGPRGCAGYAVAALTALLLTTGLAACQHNDPPPTFSECVEQGGLSC